MKDYTVTKKQNGKYSCSEEGVTFYRNSKNRDYWIAKINKEEFRNNKSFSVSLYGLEGSCEKAIKQVREWRDKFGLTKRQSGDFKRQVDKIKGVGMVGFCNTRLQKCHKKRIKITKQQVNDAVKEYLANGGKITKIETPVYNTNQRPVNEADEFLFSA